ncbi:MAG TPA: ATP-binding cassette domain-containing protein [candidate division Zixibacteria bacterium]|nr:ATP-binding cassette domain-containing protein [candidate division Zixibacteria bacterium]
MVRFEGVTYRYGAGAPAALANVGALIQPGESVAVMGANGSGKSTFARLAAGLFAPTEGRVTVRNQRGEDTRAGILFQNPDNQMVAVTVEKEIAFALENAAVPPDVMARRVTQTLKRFSIAHLRQRLTAELSGGEKQRVALAAVMVSEPTVLVLDEPDSFLDEAGKAMLRTELENLRRSQPSMIQIHITQYPQTARQYPRLMVFFEGRVAADGRPERIFADDAFCRETAIAFDPRASDGEGSGAASIAAKDRRVARVELKEAAFAYAAIGPVLPPLNATVQSGEVLGVVGPSGSGKSTLGLLLCRVLEPTSGRILYIGPEGGPVFPESAPGRVSAILQQPERQFFLPTCEQEVEFGPENIGRPLTITETHAMLRLAGLDPTVFGKRDPFRLSGGEKRRLAFAAVLSLRPDIVVFDEPTCGLDQEGVGRFIRLARTLRAGGAGVVVISHDGDVIRALADGVLVLGRDREYRLIGADEFFAAAELRRAVSPVTWAG